MAKASGTKKAPKTQSAAKKAGKNQTSDVQKGSGVSKDTAVQTGKQLATTQEEIEAQKKLAKESTKARMMIEDNNLEQEYGKKAAEPRKKLSKKEKKELKKLKGRSDEIRIIPVGAWVILAHTDNVDPRFQGHEALVTNAPVKPCFGCEFSTLPHVHQDKDTIFTVRTRDQYSAEFTASRDDFEFISWDGRVGLPTAG